MPIRKETATILLLFCFLFSWGQTPSGVNNHLIIDNGHGLVFSNGVPEPYSGYKLKAHEAKTSVSDYKGDLLFYGGHQEIFNRNHIRLKNGGGFLALPSASEGIITTPNPNNPFQYHVFHNSERYFFHVYHSLLDMRMDQGMGGIIDSVKNIPLSTQDTLSEFISLVNGPTCTQWLVGLNDDFQTFFAYKIDTLGIHPPVYTHVNLPSSLLDAGEMEVSHGQDFIILHTLMGQMYKFFFNNLTGRVDSTWQISPSGPIDTSGFLGGYGMKISHDDRYLIANQMEGYYYDVGVQMVRFDLNNASPEEIWQSKTPIGPYNFNTVVDSGIPGDFVFINPTDIIQVDFWDGRMRFIKNVTGQPIVIDTNFTFDKSKQISFRWDYPNRVFMRQTFDNFVKYPDGLNPREVLVLPEDTAICPGDSLALFDLGIGEPLYWEDHPKTLFRWVKQPGQYVATRKGTCATVRDTIEIRFEHEDLGGLPDTINLCEHRGDEFGIYGIEPNQLVEWNDGVRDAFRSFNSPGLYTASVINHGCLFKDSIYVEGNQACCEVYIPNAFTPNGDGINETFVPVFSCLPESAEIFIYDRWGKLQLYDTYPFYQLKNWSPPRKNNIFSGQINYRFDQRPNQQRKFTIHAIH